MGWIGTTLGWLYGQRSGGLLGGLAGAVLGSLAENWLKDKFSDKASPGKTSQGEKFDAPRAAREREVIFLTAIGAMLAKLSKSDGCIDQSEIDAGERAFVRLGLSAEKREFCIRAFRTAKSDPHSIYEYAEAFTSVEPDADMRELVYDILWDVACADGVVTPEERHILELIVVTLRLRRSLFFEQAARRMRHKNRKPANERPGDPYEVIGCPRNATDAEVRRAYREKAKKFHPDILRAQGLPDEMLARANDQMARINAAWDQIKQERGLS